jgi:hypothetical protein
VNLKDLIEQPRAKTLQCKWRQWFINLNDEDKDVILSAFKDHELETTQLTRALQAYGCPSSPTTIRTHRRGECKTCN